MRVLSSSGCVAGLRKDAARPVAKASPPSFEARSPGCCAARKWANCSTRTRCSTSWSGARRRDIFALRRSHWRCPEGATPPRGGRRYRRDADAERGHQRRRLATHRRDDERSRRDLGPVAATPGRDQWCARRHRLWPRGCGASIAPGPNHERRLFALGALPLLGVLLMLRIDLGSGRLVAPLALPHSLRADRRIRPHRRTPGAGPSDRARRSSLRYWASTHHVLSAQSTTGAPILIAAQRSRGSARAPRSELFNSRRSQD